MTPPVVTIVGRPNVGKSTLLNAFIGERLAIVDPTAGVTRDRLSVLHEHEGYLLEIVDTGGIGIIDNPELAEQVEQQIQFALDRADIILFLVDTKDGITPLDRRVAKWLRGRDIPILLVANKADNPALELQASEFHGLGLGTPHVISAQGRMGVRSLLDEAVSQLPSLEEGEQKTSERPMRIALVGKRNAGKSTFINALAGEERVIVNEIPGTTRDSIDVRFEKDGLIFIAVDTAGIRKKRKAQGSIEFYGMIRAERAIRRADVVLFLIDATLSVGQIDRRIADQIRSAHKACAIVINKWDLALETNVVTEKYDEYLARTLPGISYAPIIFTTANTGRNVFRAIDLARSLYNRSGIRISTGPLNRAVRAAFARRRPQARRGKVGKIYYASQVKSHPPTVLLFVNDPFLFPAPYRRFMENHLRDILGFEEVPIRLVLRSRGPSRRKGPQATIEELVDSGAIDTFEPDTPSTS